MLDPSQFMHGRKGRVAILGGFVRVVARVPHHELTFVWLESELEVEGDGVPRKRELVTSGLLLVKAVVLDTVPLRLEHTVGPRREYDVRGLLRNVRDIGGQCPVGMGYVYGPDLQVGPVGVLNSRRSFISPRAYRAPALPG